MVRLIDAPPGTRARLPQLMAGLTLCGFGIALMVQADLGLDPWTVFHQGIADRTGLGIGVVTILVGAVVFLGWIPLRQRPGVGTICNLLWIGLTTDLFLLAPFPSDSMPARVAALVVGALLIGIGAGIYIGAGLGTGPRDGIMTGLVARGLPLRAVRTSIELTVLAAGWLLGGTVGLGTVLFALIIGPVLHASLHRFDRGQLVREAIEGDLDAATSGL